MDEYVDLLVDVIIRVAKSMGWSREQTVEYFRLLLNDGDADAYVC